MKGKLAIRYAVSMQLVFLGLGYANNINQGGMNGLIRSASAVVYEQGRLNVGASLKHDWDRGYLKGPSGLNKVMSSDSTLEEAETPLLISTNIFAGLAVLPFLEVGINVPYYHDKTGFGKTASGIGDLEVGLKLQNAFQKEDAPVQLAYFVRLILPTGKEGVGYFPRHSYYIDGAHLQRSETGGDNFYTNDHFAPAGMVMFTVFLNQISNIPLVMHVNIDGRVRVHPKRDLAEVAYMGFEFTHWKNVTPFMEMSMENRKNFFFNKTWDFKNLFKDPVWLTPGLKLSLANNLYAVFAFDLGLIRDETDSRTTYDNSGYKYSVGPMPRYGYQITFGWNGMFGSGNKKNDAKDDGNAACF
ncbi:MAG: hypothetical protein GF344_18875 [Chitinivibrionales bacterium]|nr:hypothetical protein [Chitinivibrionales bacterium]